jgi:hypothetical protein
MSCRCRCAKSPRNLPHLLASQGWPPTEALLELIGAMKSLALTVLFASTVALAVAQNSDSGMAIPHTDWRKEILSSYVFEQPPKALPSVSTPPVFASTGSEDQAMVKLPEFIVRDSTINMSDLNAVILQSQATTRIDEVSSRLGIGVHELQGKRVTLGAATIFYVPVAFGIAW